MWRIIILTLFFKGCVDYFDCFVCAQFNQSEIMEDYCYDFRYQSCISRRTHLYFNAPLDVSRTEQHVYSQSDVTMVTQLQYNRLSGLLALIKSWTGPLQVRVMLLCAHAYQPYVIHTSRVLCCNVLMHTSHSHATISSCMSFIGLSWKARVNTAAAILRIDILWQEHVGVWVKSVYFVANRWPCTWLTRRPTHSALISNDTRSSFSRVSSCTSSTNARFAYCVKCLLILMS